MSDPRMKHNLRRKAGWRADPRGRRATRGGPRAKDGPRAKGGPRSAAERPEESPQISRTFFEVLPDGATAGSLEDKKLRLTRRILFLARRWRLRLDEALRQTGETHARWLTLLWIEMLAGHANIGELAEHVGVELPTLVRLLNRLEREGLVVRRALGSSQRAKTAVLTARARQQVAAMDRVVTRTRADFLRDIDERQLTVALELLDDLLARNAKVVTWRPPA
jgi:MarR family transcriptional regulator, transcriptional regulator for hemolysin